jgi:hypothetical protein
MKRILFSFILLSISLNSFSQVVYTNNFTGGGAGWNLGAGGNFDTWIVNNIYNCSDVTPNQGGGNYLHIYDDLFGEMCAYSGFLGSGSGGTVYATQTADFSTSGYSSVQINFDWLCQGQTGPILASYGFIEYSTNGGVGWNSITSPIAQYNGQSTWTTISFTNAGMGNQSTVRIRFGFTNSGYGTNPAFAIDNITITGIVGTCTNVGGTATATPNSICSGNTSVLTVAGSTGAIQWEQSPDGISSWANVTGGSGATTSSYTTPALFTTTYYRAKLSQASCPDVYSTVASVTVTSSVAASVNIGANPSGPICAGTNVLFTATPTNGGTPTYQWFLGATPVGSGSTYSNSSLTNGNQISCIMTSTATCATGSPATSNTITMTVNSNPVASITPPGPVTYCSDTSIVLSCSPVGNYLWNDGTTTNNMTPGSGGNYYVVITDGNGCSDTAYITVTINPTPNVSISGNDTICVGEFTMLTASGADSYVWSTSQTINPIMVSPGGNITYTVTGTENMNFCTATGTISIVATANTIDVSLSSIDPITLHSNANGSTYQWIDCGNGNIPLGGETNQNFTATVNGSYAVIVSQGACSDTSGCIAINSVGIDENQSSQISVYPNPSTGTFTINSTLNGNYSIVDGLGKVVRSIYLNTTNNFTLEVENLSNGIYFIIGENEKGKIHQKIIVTK